jgi:hypothetical protein
LAAFRHEGLGGQAVEFRKPRCDVAEHWLDKHTAAGTANSDAVAFKSELARQTHGLTSSVLKEFGGGHRLSKYIP